MKRSPRTRNALALAAVASLAVAACGSDDDAADVVDDVTDAAEDVAEDAEEVAEDAVDEVEEAADDAVEEVDDAMEDDDAMEEGDDAMEEGDEAAEEVPADWPESIVFTLTPSAEAGGLIETADPLAELLEAELGIDVEPLVPTDYAGVIVALQSGQAQVAGGLGPRQMVQAEEQAGAELILQAERFGSLLYVTQWFTNDPDTYCDD